MYAFSYTDARGYTREYTFDNITDARISAIKHLKKSIDNDLIGIYVLISHRTIEYIKKIRGYGVPSRYISSEWPLFDSTPKIVDPDTGRLGKEYRGSLL